MIDSHCHLGHLGVPAHEALEEAAAAGIDAVIDIGMGTEESAGALARAQENPGRVFASVGIHPNDVGEYVSDPAGTIARLRELASADVVVGIGETGIDLYRDRSAPADQEASFRAHITLARELGKTLVIHCRDAHDRVAAVLEHEGAPDRVVMHCFSGDEAFARLCALRGWYCSFAGNLTYPRNESLRDGARVVPAELLLVETDAPYLAPVPHRGKPSRPAHSAITAAMLASARGTAIDRLGPQLTENTRRAFRLP